MLALELTGEAAMPMAFLGNIGIPEMMVLGLVVLLLFGNRLPSVMRSLGVGVTEFKKGIRGEGLSETDSLEDQRRVDEHDRSLTSK